MMTCVVVTHGFSRNKQQRRRAAVDDGGGLSTKPWEYHLHDKEKTSTKWQLPQSSTMSN